MNIRDLIPPDPVPVAKDDLNPPRDFCATIVDTNLEKKDIPITKLLFKDNVPEEFESGPIESIPEFDMDDNGEIEENTNDESAD